MPNNTQKKLGFTDIVYNKKTGNFYENAPGDNYNLLNIGSGDGGVGVSTADVTLVNPTTYSSLPDTGGLMTQSDLNTWVYDSLTALAVPLTYTMGTDKVMRAGDAAIELVDSEGYYSDVKFTGLGGIVVTSDLNSIIIDASGVESGGDVNLDDYARLDGAVFTSAVTVEKEFHVHKAGPEDYLTVKNGKFTFASDGVGADGFYLEIDHDGLVFEYREWEEGSYDSGRIISFKDGKLTAYEIILTSPNNTKYKLQVADDGTLSTTAV